ncbi:MAG: acyl-CoA dehydrogenase, partial [Brevibacterium aurantiacum]|nr:acyl-CoA dehydrogenase [Brevibacterium aurantiacum]
MLETTDRGRDYQERLTTFMEDFVYPAEPVYAQQMAAANSPHTQPQILEDLKAEAKSRGLWNLFHPDPQWGPGLTNLEY